MKMKKSISLLCCVIIASMGIILTGCGNSSNNKDSENSGEKYADSPYVGTWEAKVAEYEGVKYDAEEAIGVSKFTFNADGTGTYITDDMKEEIEWEPTEDGAKFADDSGVDYFTYKDGNLLLNLETEEVSLTVHYEKLK